MYLSDQALRKRLAELEIECDTHPFDEAEQLQPASIDLRLSNVFWIPRKGAVVDLIKERAVQLSPFRFWTRREHTATTPVVLHPGELILARVHEKLSSPRDCAGKFEGRSSYARLGLSVHCTGDFANPGYRGHMPLQLVNNGQFTLRIYPYMPICQLMLVQLTEPSNKKYGGDDVASKYMNDDGGPSYWWRDAAIKQLRIAVSSHKDLVEDQLYSKISDLDADAVERLATFIEERPIGSNDTADDVLLDFAASEDSLRRKANHGWEFWLAGAGISVAVLISELTKDSIDIARASFFLVCSIVAAIVTLQQFRKPRPSSFFTLPR